MSGFGAPAFTATPTFEIISRVLPLHHVAARGKCVDNLGADNDEVRGALFDVGGERRSALEADLHLVAGRLSNIGTSVPMTSGSGPPPATTVISPAFGQRATSALRQPAIAANLDHVFMENLPLCRLVKNSRRG